VLTSGTRSGWKMVDACGTTDTADLRLLSVSDCRSGACVESGGRALGALVWGCAGCLVAAGIGTVCGKSGSGLRLRRVCGVCHVCWR